MALLQGLNRNAAGAVMTDTDSATVAYVGGIPVNGNGALRIKTSGGAKTINGILHAADGSVVVSTSAPQRLDRGAGFRAAGELCITTDAPAATAQRVFLPTLGALLVNAAGSVHTEEEA